ncbi:MAG: DMT family transporter [Angelakisella sp.]|nr:DMT family transporter [Angelakisella sp.]
MNVKTLSGSVASNNRSSFALGVVFILISSLGFALNQSFSTALGESAGVFEKMFTHNMVGVVVFGFVLWKDKISVLGSNKQLMFSRALFGFLSTLFVVVATTFSSRPLFELSVLTSTSAIFTVLTAAVWLKEKVGKSQVLVVLICFLGVLITVRPSPELLTDPFCLFALLGAAFGGAAYCVVRKLKNFAHPYAVVFCYCAFSALCALPFYIVELARGAQMPGFTNLLYLVGMGIGVSVGQLFLNLAYRQAEASRLSPYSYVQNVYTLLISLLIFHQTIPVYSYIGAALIIGANYLNLRLGQAAERKVLHSDE